MTKENKRIKIIIIKVLMFLAFFLLMKETNLFALNVKGAVTLENPKIEKDNSMQAGQKVTWDCIWFGSYPQSEVNKSAAVYKILQNLPESSWNANNDTIVNGVKYRRLKGEDATYYRSDSEYYYDWKDDYLSYHYFKFEPIKWRIMRIDNDEIILLSNESLDAQYFYPEKQVTISWEESTLRSWLNGYGSESNLKKSDYSMNNFIDNAFCKEEQMMIKHTIEDKIILLSENEWEKYGFIDGYNNVDEAKRCECSTYAWAMGLYRNLNSDYFGNCHWWVVYGENNSGAAYITSQMIVMYNAYLAQLLHCGIRPIIHLSCVEDNLYSYAGTVCSDGTVNEKKSQNNKANSSNSSILNDITTNGSEITSSISKTTLSKQGTLKFVKSPKKRTIKITWKKLSGITGYQVYISKKKNFTRRTFQRYIKGKKATCVIIGLKSKKNYYIKMRPYKKVGKVTYYGVWSKIKRVKVK